MSKKRKFGSIKRKSSYPKKDFAPTSNSEESADRNLSCEKVAEVALDLWRVGQRAKSENASDRVLAACERAEDRIKRLGFKLDTMQDRIYDEHLRVRVVEHEPGEGARVISECLNPAVFFNGVLIKEAEVVTRGGE